MSLPNPTHKLDEEAEMADLWLLHCEGLQAEVERLKQENDRLLHKFKPVNVEKVSVVSFKNQVYASPLEAMAAEVCKNPRDKKLLHSFGLSLSTMLLLNPSVVCAQIATGGDWAEALELVTTALDNTPLGDQLHRVRKFRYRMNIRTPCVV